MPSLPTSARHLIRLSNGCSINILNSLGGKREALSTATEGILKWYSCGPTVYDDAHLGHGRAYVSFDIIRRLLQTRTGVNIEFALGMTDIDDKIIQRANEQGRDALELARFYEQRFFHDMSSLNVLYPTHILRVTEHIDDVQSMIERLESQNMAYVPKGSGNVYFSVKCRGERYSQLDPSRNVDGESEPQGEKTDQRDFALWKSKEEGQLVNWDSKWGKGRPGWHVECSAMSIRTMGDYLDLHTGGIDLRFPHHTNELATAEAFLGLCGECDRWSHTWLHAGHLHISGLKMSKSLKNFITIRSFLDPNDNPSEDDEISGCASVFRLFCLAFRYSAPIELDHHRVVEARAILKRINAFVGRDTLKLMYESPNSLMKPNQCPIASNIYSSLHGLDDQIDNAIANNFDTPALLRTILNCIDVANTTFKSSNQPVSIEALMAFEETRQRILLIFHQLGFDFHRQLQSSSARFDDIINMLVDFRYQVRTAAKEKDISSVFQLCDKLRDQAHTQFGVHINDGKDSSSWNK